MAKIAVLGAGAWGTSIANLLARNANDVILHAREEEVIESINSSNVNSLFLPQVTLENNLKATNKDSDLEDREAIFLVVPTQFTMSVLNSIKSNANISSSTSLIICSKGIENSTKRLISDIVYEVFPDNELLVMSGPNFADEIATNKAAVTTIAGENSDTVERIKGYLKNDNFNPIACNDIIGAQIGGSIKNIIAIGLGIANGLNFSESSKAAMLTEGLNEMGQLSLFFGGYRETMLEPCGIGDLALTCSSLKSRNMSLGYELGKGKSLDEILKSRNSVAEGVYTTKAAYEIMKEENLKLPLIEKIYKILYDGESVENFTLL